MEGKDLNEANGTVAYFDLSALMFIIDSLLMGGVRVNCL
jgi:hypothetical protein